MCGVKMMDRKNIDEVMDMLGLDETMDKMAKTNKMRWYGHVLKREDGDGLQKGWAKERKTKDDMKNIDGKRNWESWSKTRRCF